MSPGGLRSIVPMFGGATQYVQSLNAILEFVEAHHPTTDELVGWHRGSFANVSSRDSIMRRIKYLQQVGFLQEKNERWGLGEAGGEYFPEQEIEDLLRIMCDRNVGLRSLMYALSAGPMTIAEISNQQLNTHSELGWSQGETDMAKQRVNWLRSMGLIEQQGNKFALTTEGHEFVTEAVGEWAETEWTASIEEKSMSASSYATQTYARAIDPEFRMTVLSRYQQTCPVSGVDHPGLLDVAHVLS